MKSRLKHHYCLIHVVICLLTGIAITQQSHAQLKRTQILQSNSFQFKAMQIDEKGGMAFKKGETSLSGFSEIQMSTMGINPASVNGFTFSLIDEATKNILARTAFRAAKMEWRAGLPIIVTKTGQEFTVGVTRNQSTCKSDFEVWPVVTESELKSIESQNEEKLIDSFQQNQTPDALYALLQKQLTMQIMALKKSEADSQTKLILQEMKAYIVHPLLN